MNIFKEEQTKEAIDKQLSRIGFHIEYKEEENHITAKLETTSRFKSHSTSLEDWRKAILRYIEERLVEGKTINIEFV